MIHEPKWSSNFLQRIFEPFLCFILRTWIESGKGKLCAAIFNFLGLFTTCTHLEFMLTGTKSFLTQPHTPTVINTHEILLADSACEQEVTAPECVFLDFPNSLCSLLPSVCSPETWWEESWTWWEEKGGSVPSASCVDKSTPGFFTWRRRQWPLHL